MSIEIIGLREYQEYIDAFGDDALNTRYFFHPDFIWKVLEKDSRIELMGLEDFRCFPESQGIYFCIRSLREIWYIGKSSNFRKRWKRHHKFEALKAIQDVCIYFLSLEDSSAFAISNAEQAYIKMLKPAFNNTSKPEKYLSIAS